MEMSFDGTVVLHRRIYRQRRLTRARWWFAQMRQVVDRAWDWQSASAGQPEQGEAPLSQTHGRN